MSLKKSISNLKLPHYKSTAGMAAVRMPIPREVLIPLSPMNAHHATQSEPIVQGGDHVTVGQMIARGATAKWKSAPT